MSDHSPATTTIKNRTSGTTRRLRGIAGGSLGFAAVAAILVLAAPMSLAHGTVTLVAPYGGTATPSSYVNASGVCASASNAVPLSWNSSTGALQFAGATHAGSCGGSNYAYAEGYATLASPAFSAPMNGAGYVYVSLSAAFSAQATLHLAASTSNTSYKFAEAGVFGYVSASVYQLGFHNETYVGSAYGYLVDQYFYVASGSFSLTQGWTTTTLYASVPFSAGHLYVVDTTIELYVFADTYGGGSSASASIDAGGSNGVDLQSITAY